jgi:glycosyltransferase 2 family protein
MNSMKPSFRAFSHLLFILIICVTSYFFYKEMKSNWASLSIATTFKFNLASFLLSSGLVIASYLLMTFAWHYGIKAYPSSKRTTLVESFAIVNTTQMTKYLPGKVWSYALQMFIMQAKDIPKSYILYINLYIWFSLLLSNCLFASSYVMLYSVLIPKVLAVALFCFLAVTYSLFIFLNENVIRSVIHMANRIFRKNMEFYKLELSVVLKIQAALLMTNALFGLAASAACACIGWNIPPSMIFPVSVITLFADLLGVIIFLSPGGLGIREGAMFFLLNGIAGKRVALLLPLAFRFISMASDLILGFIAFILFRKFILKRK